MPTQAEIDAALERIENLDPDDAHWIDATPLRQITEATQAIRAAEANQREAVQVARARGISWNLIALALGVSRQAARQRFADKEAKGSATHQEQLNKTQLIDAVASDSGLSKADSARAVESLLGTVKQGALKKGDEVSITGFGKFSVVKRASRTGERAKIKASKTPKFTAGASSKRDVSPKR